MASVGRHWRAAGKKKKLHLLNEQSSRMESRAELQEMDQVFYF